MDTGGKFYLGRIYDIKKRQVTEEPLLYDPLLPSYAIMLDDLPGSPRIDQGGNIKTATPAAAFLSLILPAVTIIGHGTYIWLNFLR